MLLNWLESSSVNTHHVIEQTLVALSILPLASTPASYPADKLQHILCDLLQHPNESVRQAADELLSSLALQAEDEKRHDEEDEEDEAAAGRGGESKFHLIKIDKTTAEHHEHGTVNGSKLEVGSTEDEDKQAIVFDTPLSPPLSPDSKAEADVHAVSEDKQKQRSMADRIEAVDEQQGKAEVDDEASTEQRASKKRKRLSVRWVEDERLEDVRLFFKDELIVKKDKKKATVAETQEDKSTIDWYTPPPLTALPSQSQQAVNVVPVSNEERAGKRQAAFPGFKPSGSESGVTVDLLSSLTSLATMLSSSASASSSTPSSAGVSSAPSSFAPAPATVSAPPSSNLSALLSNLSALSTSNVAPVVPSSYPSAAAPVNPAPAPGGGASRLLSLLSNSSALSGLAASLQAPSQPAPQPQYPPHPTQQPYPPQPAAAPAVPPLLPYHSQQSPYAPLPPSTAAAAPPPSSYRPPLLPPPGQPSYYASAAPPVGYPPSVGHSHSLVSYTLTSHHRLVAVA